jgi:hypothetical protein
LSEAEGSDWFEDAWAFREESLYPQILRRSSLGQIYTLDAEVFERFGFTTDPRWLHCGVVPFAGNEQQPMCALVSSGLSNDWNAEEPDPEAVSGLGFELRLELRHCAEWGIVILLRLMALQLLVSVGKMPDPPLRHGQVVPLGGPIAGGSALTHLLACKSPDAPSLLHFASGRFELLLLTGITASEAAFAAANGADQLLALLPKDGSVPITDPQRGAII